MPVALVTDNPTLLANTYSQGFNLVNQGTVPVYLSSNSALTVAAYEYVLAPGQSLGWSGGTELWTVAPTGKTSTISYMYGVSNTFAPAPDNVTVSGAVEISGITTVSGTVEVSGTTTVAGTVAVEGPVTVTGSVGVTGPVTVSGDVGITGDVSITGGVTIDNSVVNVGGAVASHAANKPVLLGTLTLNANVGVNLGSIAQAFDVSDFSSIIVYAQFTKAAGSNDPSKCGMMSVQIDQESTAIWMMLNSESNGSLCRYQVNVSYTSSNITLAWQRGPDTTQAGTITLSVYGSSESVVRPRYVHQSPVLKGSAALGLATVSNTSASAVLTDYFASRSGETYAAYAKRYSGGAGACSLNVMYLDRSSQALYAGTMAAAAAAGSTQYQQVYLPPMPVVIVLNNTATSLPDTSLTINTAP